MKKTFLFLSFISVLLTSSLSFAQDIAQHPVSDSIQLEARERANELMQILGLTTKQALLVEDKLTEFLVYKKEVVNSSMTTEQKTRKLNRLLAHKFSEMQDILTQIQYDLYLKMK